MTKRRLAIIGNGMATGRLLDDLARRGAGRTFDITVFGEERHGCYNRILLGRILAGGTADEIMLKPAEWYTDAGITFHAGQKVTRLDGAARTLYTADGCSACHSLTGAAGVGPTFKGLAGSQVTLAEGTTVTADDAYLERSITSPDAQIVKGYSAGIMPPAIASYNLNSNPQDIRALVAFIKSQK